MTAALPGLQPLTVLSQQLDPKVIGLPLYGDLLAIL